MKTLVLTKKELDNLPKEVQDQIMAVCNARKNEISELKSRVNSLKYKSIDYRYDIEKVDRTEGENNLIFDIWQKTDGEQWGNCAGRKYEIRIGKKYIRVDIEFYATNNSGSHWSVYLSSSKLAEILDLLEESEKSEEIDADNIISIACYRLKNAVES